MAAGVHDICIKPELKKDHGWQLTYVKKIHHEGRYVPDFFDNDIAGKNIIQIVSLYTI